MAEYINRAKVDYEFITTRGGGDTIVNLYERILDIPTADVVEREKVKSLIEVAIEDGWDLDYALERLKEI